MSYIWLWVVSLPLIGELKPKSKNFGFEKLDCFLKILNF